MCQKVREGFFFTKWPEFSSNKKLLSFNQNSYAAYPLVKLPYLTDLSEYLFQMVDPFPYHPWDDGIFTYMDSVDFYV